MSDLVDRANKQQQAWLEAQVRQARLNAQPTDDTECIDCGEPIGKQRKRAMPSAVRCIQCASKRETPSNSLTPSNSPLSGGGRKAGGGQKGTKR